MLPLAHSGDHGTPVMITGKKRGLYHDLKKAGMIEFALDKMRALGCAKKNGEKERKERRMFEKKRKLRNKPAIIKEP